jgi:hypothetical protein
MARDILLIRDRISCTANNARESIHTTERTWGTLFSRSVIHEKVTVAIVSLVVGISLWDDVLRTWLSEDNLVRLRAFRAGSSKSRGIVRADVSGADHVAVFSPNSAADGYRRGSRLRAVG